MPDGASIGNSTATPFPYGDDEFDVALLCDALHDAPEDAARLLAEAGRVARHVLVKDQFTREGFVRLATEQRLVITALDSGLDLGEHLPAVARCFAPTGSSSPCCAAARPYRGQRSHRKLCRSEESRGDGLQWRRAKPLPRKR